MGRKLLAASAEEDDEEAWLLNPRQPGDVTESDAEPQSGSDQVSVACRLKFAVLCFSAIAGIVLMLEVHTSRPQQHQSRFMHSFVAKFDPASPLQGVGAKTPQDVSPPSLFLQCYSGVPTACDTSFVRVARAVVLILLCLAAAWLVYRCLQSGPREEELRIAEEKLQRLLRFNHVEFPVVESWGPGETEAEVVKKMQRAWNPKVREENLEVVEEVAKILNQHPRLQLRVTAVTPSNGENSHRTEMAFNQDFQADFPNERMDRRLPYAHAQVLSVKRLLRGRGIAPERLHHGLEAGSTKCHIRFSLE
mmetsp:Transcript_26527/g.61712  ORF Transcript_26527/g.61712 Transcript_26527/m.61712 type:complete len:306 (+) Transcript_26527:66-983(+)